MKAVLPGFFLTFLVCWVDQLYFWNGEYCFLLVHLFIRCLSFLNINWERIALVELHWWSNSANDSIITREIFLYIKSSIYTARRKLKYINMHFSLFNNLHKYRIYLMYINFYLIQYFYNLKGKKSVNKGSCLVKSWFLNCHIFRITFSRKEMGFFYCPLFNKSFYISWEQYNVINNFE